MDAAPTLEQPRQGRWWLFAGDKARQMAAKSVEARKNKRAERSAAIVISDSTEVKEPSYLSIRLVRVRKQLDALDRYMNRLLNPGNDEQGNPKPIDEQAIERVARASKALSDLEADLDQRPARTSIKRVEPKQQRQAMVEPLG